MIIKDLMQKKLTNSPHMSIELEEFPKERNSTLFSLIQLLNELVDKHNVADILAPLRDSITQLSSQTTFQAIKKIEQNNCGKESFVHLVEPLISLLNKSCMLSDQPNVTELHLNIMLKLISTPLLCGYNNSGVQLINPLLHNLLDWYPSMMNNCELTDELMLRILQNILNDNQFKLEQEVKVNCINLLQTFLSYTEQNSNLELASKILVECTKTHLTTCPKLLVGQLNQIFETIRKRTNSILIRIREESVKDKESDENTSDKKSFLFRKKKTKVQPKAIVQQCSVEEKILQLLGIQLLTLIISQQTIEKELLEFVRNNSVFVLTCMFCNDSEVVDQILKFVTVLMKNTKTTMKRNIDILLSSLILYFNGAGLGSEVRLKIFDFFVTLLQQPEVCVEIYMNYDCDLESSFDILNNILMSVCDASAKNDPFISHSIAAICAFIKSVNDWNSTATSKDSLQSQENSPIQRILKSGEFERMRDLKTQQEYGFVLFNKNCTKGIEHLIKEGILIHNSDKIATFLMENIQQLSPIQLGLYFSIPANSEIYQKFLDKILINESGLIEALRKTLRFFQLPPESQQIDRLIEGFAKVFLTKCNSPHKWTSDSAYIISYAIIILNTDLHNKNVTSKIKKNEFLKNSQFMVDLYDVDKKFLEEIYCEVAKNPIIYCQDEHISNIKVRKNSSLTLHPKYRNDCSCSVAELLERARILNSSSESASKTQSIFYYATHEENFHDLLFVSFKCLLNSIKILVQLSKEKDHQDALFKALFLLSCATLKLGMQDEFEQTFYANISLLPEDFSVNATSVSHKTLLSIRNLLCIAQYGKNAMFSMWPNLCNTLEVVNQLKLFTDTRYIDFCPLYNFLDKFVSSTVELDEKNISRLIQCLSKASRNEIFTRGETFFLEKLLEIAHYNTNRVKYEWYQIWTCISDLFIEIVHENVSLYIFKFIINSLKQLTFNYLDQFGKELEEGKGETISISIQRDIVYTFYELLTCTDSEDIIELTIECLYQITLTYGHLMQNGWISILKCVEISLTKAARIISIQCFKIWKIFSEKCTNFENSAKQIQMFKNIFVLLLKDGTNTKQHDNCIEIYRLVLQKYFLTNLLDPKSEIMLAGIQEGCNWSCNLEVRSACLNMLFTYFNYDFITLPNYYELFCNYFYTLFNPIINEKQFITGNLQSLNEQDDLEEYLKTTLISAYKYFSLLIISTGNTWKSKIFTNFISLIESSIDNSDISINQIGLYCLKEVLIEQPGLFREDKLIEILNKLYQNDSIRLLFCDFLIEVTDSLVTIISGKCLFSFFGQLNSNEFGNFQWKISNLMKEKYDENNNNEELNSFINCLIEKCFNNEVLYPLIGTILSEKGNKDEDNCSVIDKQLIQMIRNNKEIDLNDYRESIANYLMNRLEGE